MFRNASLRRSRPSKPSNSSSRLEGKNTFSPGVCEGTAIVRPRTHSPDATVAPASYEDAAEPAGPFDLITIRRRLAAHEALIRPPAEFEASVAMVLRPSPAGPEALFIERARKPGDPWSGQMALPGGRRDETDRDLQHTAERETAEEVGLSLEGARLIGRLDDQTGQRAGQGQQLRIAAFVYEVDAGTGNNLILNYEVAEAFWVPLAWFEDPSRVIDYRHPPYPGVSFPGVVVGEPERHVVWGLTFRFLSAFFGIVGRRFAANR